MSRGRWIAFVLGLMGLIVAWRVSGPPSRAADSAAHCERLDLLIEADITGTLRAVESSRIGPPQVREIRQFKIAMMAPEGSEVSQGQPVLAFDDSEIRRQLEGKLAELDAAVKEVEKEQVDLAVTQENDVLAMATAEADLRKARLKAGKPSQAYSSIEIRKAELELELAATQVESTRRRIEASQRAGEAELAAIESDRDRAQSEVDALQRAIQQMTRTAPRDGLVIYAIDWQGNRKKVGDSCHSLETVLELPDLSSMEGEASVPEALAGRVMRDQTVRFRLDAYPDRVYSGVVRSISRTVQRKSWRSPLKVVRLVVALDKTDPEHMRPGMRFRGTVETRRLASVLTIPLEAVFSTDEGPVAFRRGFGGWRRTHLELGERNRDAVEVLGGVEEGDRVSLSWRGR